jgi:hypothetical protein
MTEPKARAAESGEQSKVRVAAPSPRSGEVVNGAPMVAIDWIWSCTWVEHQ